MDVHICRSHRMVEENTLNFM